MKRLYTRHKMMLYYMILMFA